MDKKTISILVTTLILAAIPLTVYLGQQRQQTVSEAAPATVLSVSPEAVTKEVGDTFTIEITINTGENSVVGVDLDLSFNSSVLECLTISPGGFFDDPDELAKNIDNQTGEIIYSLSSFAPKQGAGILASIEFEATTAGVSTLIFDSGTSVAGVGEDEALQNTVPGSITVTGGDASPTPTPTPTPPGQGGPGPTSTPTPTPTTSASGGPTPTPTTTSGGTGSVYNPTATPTPTRSASGGPAAGSSVPEAGIAGPTVFISLLSLLLVGLGLIAR